VIDRLGSITKGSASVEVVRWWLIGENMLFLVM
jgi:hypothetical protein